MKNINERNNFVFEFRPVTELFEEQVKLHPEKWAVVSGKESFTYAQLNERANRIANALVEKDVRRETIVGVVLERCCDFYAVRQGILKAGGAFTVAAPDYPDDRIQYIFEDARIPFVITTKEIEKERQDLFAKLDCKVLLLEELLENENAENPDVEIKENDLCYCIYTSGSRGKPKGLMIEHVKLANFVNPDPKNAETFGYVDKGLVSLSMAAMTEQIIAMSIKSLEEQDTKLARETVEFDAKINEAEREVERICLNLLLQQQPVFAEDLRRVSAALKMITDIERVGDQSADIADLNIQLIKKKQKWDLSDISEMARAATQMVNDAIDAYVNDDENLARKVISSDDKIDELFVKTKDKIIDEIAADKANSEKAIDTLMVAKYFERIGDHATNIAEWVEFALDDKVRKS